MLIYSCRNVFRQCERFGHILANIPREQLCAWCSGDSETGMNGFVEILCQNLINDSCPRDSREFLFQAIIQNKQLLVMQAE
jgi:hypothetical protein